MKSATLSRPKKRSRAIRHRPPKAMVGKAAPAETVEPEETKDDCFAKLYIGPKEEGFEKPARVVLGEKAFCIISEFEYRSLRETIEVLRDRELMRKIEEAENEPIEDLMSWEDLKKEIESEEKATCNG